MTGPSLKRLRDKKITIPSIYDFIPSEIYYLIIQINQERFYRLMLPKCHKAFLVKVWEIRIWFEKENALCRGSSTNVFFPLLFFCNLGHFWSTVFPTALFSCKNQRNCSVGLVTLTLWFFNHKYLSRYDK